MNFSIIQIKNVLKSYNNSDHEMFQRYNFKVAGRVLSFRKMGSVAFGKIQDSSGEIQFAIRKGDSPEELLKLKINVGDIIKVTGRGWISSTNEPTVLATNSINILTKSEIPFPDKWHGISDEQTRLRKRYLDLIVNQQSRSTIKKRINLISNLRRTLEDSGFLEVETPILQPNASGAQARPFQTHHNALDSNLYLRIAPETYLKRALVAGFERVFEIGKSFRNEGIDPSHMQEFTSIEWYVSYWNYIDNLQYFDQCIKPILVRLKNIEYCGINLNFDIIPRVQYKDIFKEYTGLDPFEMTDYQEVDNLFKKKVRPNLIQPVYVLDYPAFLSPLAKRSDDDPRVVEQWQLVVNTWEIVKCYSELTDATLQRRLLEQQSALREAGDDEAMQLEEDFLEALQYGCPPCSGLGMGIDRLVALLTNQTSLRDTVMFPIVLNK